MPVLHEYENDTGVYLRSNIDGTFVTFQVYRSAARLFSRIGYKDGSVIGWEFLKPLWERGYIYTGNSGTTNKVETHLEGQKLDLKGNEKEELEQFLEKQKRESITVPEDIYSTLLDWHNGKYSKQRARDLLYQANNEQICRTSIREFSQSPIEVTGIETSKGDPAYDVISKGYEMRCVDVRESGQETNLIITYRGESGHAHGLFLNDGDLRQWKIYSSEGVVDRVVVAGCFERRFGSGVFFGNVVEIRVCDANLFDDLGIVVQNSDVRLIFMKVDSELIHGFSGVGSA